MRLGARVRVRTVGRLALGVGGRLAAGLEELRDHQHPGEDLGHVDLGHVDLGLEDVSMG